MTTRLAMITLLSVALGGVAISDSRARPTPSRKARRARADHSKALRFAGQRQRTRRPPPKAETPPKLPSALDGLGKAPSASPKTVGKSPTKPGLGTPKGIGPAKPVPSTKPVQFAFVPVDKLGGSGQPIELVGGSAMWWQADTLRMYKNSKLELAVDRPPAGRVAYLRCGVHSPKAKQKAKSAAIVTMVGNLESTHPLTGGAGVVEVPIFPGSGRETVELALQVEFPEGEYSAFVSWHLAGCEHRVD